MGVRHGVSSSRLLVASLLLMVLLASCGGQPAASENGSVTEVSLGLGYRPDVQFAPFYVAQSKGYYKDVGLNTTFNHNTVNNLFGSMTTGQNTFVFASGDEMLMAHDQNPDLQLIDVATIFQQYPVSLVVPADSPIQKLEDLKGQSVGYPGPYGATYIGLLALLNHAQLTLDDIDDQAIGFTQVAALAQGQVKAVMGYSNNEPLQLERTGFPVRTFPISDYQPLVSNGIVTLQQTYQDEPEMVANFVQATLKGLEDVINDPEGAVEISKEYVPGMDATQALEVLGATIPVYQGEGGRLGYNDSAIWEATAEFLVSQKLMKAVDDLTPFYTNIE